MAKTSAVHRQWNLGAPIIALVANREGSCVAAALGNGAMRVLAAYDEAREPQAFDLHKGVSLALVADADAHAFLSGGDDGKLFLIDPAVGAPILLTEHPGRWIDPIATSSDGARAYALGKQVYRLDEEGKPVGEPWTHPSSVGGLRFAPNGKRLAVSHYNGVSLWWMQAKASEPTRLEWKGSHLGLVWHPDGKTVVTAMQEAALHGWRIPDSKEMQMQGYAAKIRSMEFTARGRYLVTSGAEQVVCWPFFGGGPWGKAPVTLGGGGEGRLVTRVAAHPKDEMVAAGYDDGMLILAPLDGRMEMMIHPPVALHGAAVTGLVWNGAGDALFAALENGFLLQFTLESVKRAVAHV